MILKQSDKEFFLSIKHLDITRNFIEKYLVNHYDKESKKIIKAPYSWQDEFSLKKGEYINKEDIPRTNVGLFIFNKLVIEDLLEDIIGYWNTPFNKKVLGSFENNISEAIRNDRFTLENYAEYQNRLQWILAIHAEICGSFTEKTIAPSKKILEKRNKLLKENSERLANGDVVKAIQIEQELIEEAKKELAGDPGMELFNSGARSDFGNHYKNNYIMKGPVIEPISGKYTVVPTSYAEGVQKEHIPEYSSSVTQSQYPKSVGTAVGGYAVKRFYAEFQSITLGPKGSNCNSLRTLELKLTESNYNGYIDRYIVEGKKIIKLDEKNIKSYIGKTIHLRSPMFCTSDKICNVCFGDLPYKLGIKNVGLTAAKIGSNFVNLGMKTFHNSTMKIKELDVNDLLV
jgi:hypothetical protein